MDYNSGCEIICGSNCTFWDNQLTWNTTSPQFTGCFQDTVLTFVPCAFLWLLLPCKIYSLRRSKTRLLPWTLLNITKLALSCILSLLFVIKLAIVLGEQINTTSIIACIFQALTFLLSVVIIYLDRIYGVQSSAYLFCHWFILTFAGIFTAVHYSSTDIAEMSVVERVSFIVFCIFYPIIISQLILSGIKDAKPIYRTSINKKESPCENASFLSHITYSWLNSLLWNGFRREMKSNDVWEAISEVKTENSVQKYNDTVSKMKSENKPLSLTRVILRTHSMQIMKILLLFLVADVCIYLHPIILREFFQFISTQEQLWHGFVYIAGMFITEVASSLIVWQGNYYSQVIVCSIRTSVNSHIYRKSFKLSGWYKQATTTGQMINLMSVDIYRVVEFFDDALYALLFPFQITIGFYLLYNVIGPSAFAAFGAMFVISLFSAVLANRQENLESKQLTLKDERIKNLGEAILGVKVLKFFAWENPFMERIGKLRKKETWVIKNCLIIEGITNLIWSLGPLLMNMAIFATYIFSDSKNVLNVEKIFITMSIVDILQLPMFRFPLVIAGFIQARVSVARINDYLNGKEIDETAIERTFNDSEEAIVVRDATFGWSPLDMAPEAKPNLDKISIEIKKGSLIAVVGSVGCGKSSLLSAILGEMDKWSGSVSINGRIAYVAQQAWIQNTTLKQNILFGIPFDDKRYEKIIKCCDLVSDLAIMPGRDEAEIGEKGINLSGGQKQRISLARAVYDDADVYLLDDPLSAVDPLVGAHIFNNVIGPKGLLKLKTRVLVTHSLTYLPMIDNIIVMDDGKISEMGTYNELMDSNNGFARFINTYRIDERHSVPQFSRSESVKSDTKDSVCDETDYNNGQLITEEYIEHGKVDSSIYLMYLKFVGYPVIAISFLLAIVAFAFSATSTIWLSFWSMDSEDHQLQFNTSFATQPPSAFYRMGFYALFSLCNVTFTVIFIIIFIYGAMRACVTLHKKLLYSILRSPMAFFDTTPSGRIINRFSKDTETVDRSLPFSFYNILWGLMQIIEAIAVICITVPIFISVAIPTLIIYYFIQKFFIHTLDQLRRLESVTRSPIYSRFSETLAGSSTLRAFQKQNDYIQMFDGLIDQNMKHVFHVKTIFLWLGVRLDFVANFFIMFTAIFGLMHKDVLGAGTVALIINYAISTCLTFMWVVENIGTLESNIVSVERLNQYISLPPEAPWENEDKQPSSTWPDRGEIRFNNYSTKYRPELPPVLKSINFQISSGEKIGIIGRTGAGKSSVTLALFRMMEASEGNVAIDDVDISQIGLHDLRSRITVIPQDPVLFSGPLRMNLDPYGHYSNEQLWKALELAHLKDYVLQLSSGLDQDIAEGGSNLSVGQKQLLCLARALLKKTKILLLDEATAAVDSHTDSLIQSTIRSEFSDCTILTIAHRLNTIMDSTRLLVLNEGKVKAFDRPDKLLDTIKTSLDES